jgi:hypothetical protein
MLKDLQESRISYSIFEKELGVYPRAMIASGDLTVPEDDMRWREVIGPLLMQNAPGTIMKRFFRKALFNITKNQFRSEIDLYRMAHFYNFAHNKLREVKVASETL